MRGHSLFSAHDPKVEIDLPAEARYAGSDRWVLKTYADDIELHAFVDADAGKQVERIYWVQFESYLPSHPELKHSYDSTRHVTMGGMDFLVDTWLEAPDAIDTTGETDSDSAHLKALLRAKGYLFPKTMMTVRFVHLMDRSRKELMYIYSEFTAPTGFSGDDLMEGGRARSQWPRIEAGLIQRGQQGIQIHPMTAAAQ